MILLYCQQIFAEAAPTVASFFQIAASENMSYKCLLYNNSSRCLENLLVWTNMTKEAIGQFMHLCAYLLLPLLGNQNKH